MVPAAVVCAAVVDFAYRLTAARKERGFTQQAFAEAGSVHVNEIRRYEAGTISPTLDVLRNLGISLNVSTDSLVFDDDERDARDDPSLAFEATVHDEDEERDVVKKLIEAVLLKHEAKRLPSAA